MEMKFYKCKICGKVIAMLKDTGVDTICCGSEMVEIKPNTTDAAVEKHIPVYEIKDNKIYVNVGEVEHPMMAEHFIEWVSVQTDKGTQLKKLAPGQKPEVVFAICEDEKVEAVYAYCNLHGLWKK